MSCEKEVSSIKREMEKDAEGTRALDLLKALRDLPVSLKVLTDTGYDQISMMATMTNDDNVIWGELNDRILVNGH